MNIVRGRVTRDGRTFVEVSDDEGTVQFPLSPRQAQKVADRLGGEIYLGMRPETITHRGAHGADDGETFVFQRKVDVVEPTGPDTMLVFTLGGMEAIARVRPEEKVQPGEFFSFEVNMAKAKLFDAGSGNRL